MSKKRILYSISGLLVFVIAFSFIIRPSEESEGFVRSLDATPEVFERTFETYEKLDIRILTDTTKIFRPAHVRMFEEKIYVSDFTDFTIYEYKKPLQLPFTHIFAMIDPETQVIYSSANLERSFIHKVEGTEQ